MPTSFLGDLAIWLTWLLSTNFFVTLFGAFFGAWGAYFLARRAKRHDDLRDEFEAINAAILISSNIRGSLIVSKEDHALPMIGRYQKQQAKYAVWDSNRRMHRKNGILDIAIDGLTIPLPTLPIEDLHKLVFERIQANGRPKLLMSALKQAVVCYFGVVSDRNAMLQRQKIEKLPIQKFYPIYLGIAANEWRDDTFKTLVRQHGRYVDDGIWMSNRLCEDLHAYGVELRRETKIKKTVVLKADLEQENVKHVPKDKEFSSYMKQQIHFKFAPKKGKWKSWLISNLKVRAGMERRDESGHHNRQIDEHNDRC